MGHNVSAVYTSATNVTTSTMFQITTAYKYRNLKGTISIIIYKE